ncbi:MAG TPA: hypothetical protein VEU96_25495 [Bryobacteraceae bacterium]|nr:hypothetical protein [Bryobacteraceae bacterium]
MSSPATATSAPQRHWVALLFLIAVAAFFLIANNGAYHGYFLDDEMDNLVNTGELLPSDFLGGLLLPRYYTNNFRPAGHLFYRLMGDTFELRFAPYITAIHVLHLLNVLLLWLILRRLSLPLLGCCAGVLLFAFHMAVFDVYWKPMYVFDLLCGTFCLLALLFWMHDGWVFWLLCLLSSWLAFRSKEIAIMFPVALLVYELWFGKRRWLKLAPFLAISLWFGIQGLIHGSSLHADYSMSFNPVDIWHSAVYYASKLLVLPHELPPFQGALVLVGVIAVFLTAAFLVRDRRVLFGLTTFAAMLVPMLLLSNRLYGAYLYVPLIGVAIAFAAVSARYHLAIPIVFFALWIPWNYANLRHLRADALSQAEDRRRYVATLTELAHQHPEITSFIYEDGPFQLYGTKAVELWLHPDTQIIMVREEQPKPQGFLQSPRLAVLYWNNIQRRLEPVVRQDRLASYIELGPKAPVWQLGEGWFPLEGNFRWTGPHATAELDRPENASEFELKIIVNTLYLSRVPKGHLRVSINGVRAGDFDLTIDGVFTLRAKLPPGSAGRTQIAIDADPPYPSEEPKGIAVLAFGFPPKP